LIIAKNNVQPGFYINYFFFLGITKTLSAPTTTTASIMITIAVCNPLLEEIQFNFVKVN